MPATDHHPGRRGLVALGDSITVGEGQPMLGAPAASWALWLAAALELPYTNLAVNGARAVDLDRQIARLRGPYELCCLYVGVNDARAVDFEATAFAAALEPAARSAERRCDLLLMATLPLDLGRPRAGVSVLEANRVIRELAGALGAVVVDLSSLRGWRWVLPDAVHLTARGQLEVAERAARALAARGLAPRRWPGDLAGRPPGLPGVARYALTGHAVSLARDLRRRLLERTLGSRS